MPQRPLPPGVIAVALRQRVIIADIATVRRFRPEYLSGSLAWVRLLAHEFAHILHERLNDGEGERLGPRWFFEGFACLAAGQLPGRSFQGTPVPEILAAARRSGRRRYPIYEAAVSHFAAQYPLRVLVERAGTPGFEAWLGGAGEPETDRADLP